MKSFRQDNTEGYSQKELDALNEEWEKVMVECCLTYEDYGTDEYDVREKQFSDDVARR